MMSSSVPKLPAVRMTPEGDCIIQEGVSLEFPQASKFTISYANLGSRRNSESQQDISLELVTGANGKAVEDETLLSSNGGSPKVSPIQADSTSTQKYMWSPTERSLPAFPRALSMPLPSQLSHLQNPHRTSHSIPLLPLSPSTVNSQVNQIREVSVELADSIQLIVQTMLQISPPQVLDPAKEQFSACALSVPTSSMSAIFTAMKNINYISANMSSFCEQSISCASDCEPALNGIQPDRSKYNEFDIGEMLQCVGDALSGAAAQVGVDLVLYHGDTGLKHMHVSGDESGISFALSHILRQVLSTTARGDSIELGLLVGPLANLQGSPMQTETSSDMMGATPTQFGGPIHIKIRISHKYAPLEMHPVADHPMDVVTTETRPRPFFSTLFLQRILSQIGGNLVSDLPPPDSFTSGRTCDLELLLDRVSRPEEVQSTPPEMKDDDSHMEPTIEQLVGFGETLKGKRVALYASEKGSFAQHLTSYLTAWGMDVNHISPDGQIDGLTDQISAMQEETRQAAYNPVLATYLEEPSSPKASNKPSALLPLPNFIFIDDDVDVLKERLHALRFDHMPSLLHSKKRPSLSANHRPRSSPHMARLAGLNNMRAPPVVIMHFTSLANYKLVRDNMQTLVISYAATSTPLPEVMIIPKPAGPRRFLTALHTAVTKPIVDPWFSPIATSPSSPGVPNFSGSGFFPSPSTEYSQPATTNDSLSSLPQSPSSKSTNRPPGSRSNSDRSTRSEVMNNISSVLPSSPLTFPDNVEYFSAAAEKLGTSPSSGLVIQSPDGQTAGIYFHPRSKNNSRNPSSQSMERDRGQLGIPLSRRSSIARRASNGNKKDEGTLNTFSTLHENTTGSMESKPASFQGSPTSPLVSSSKLMTVGPIDDQNQPSLASGVLSPVPRSAGEDNTRKMTSPTRGDRSESSTPIRRLGKRSDTKDSATNGPTKQKGKSAATDHVVPPISVLIVDDNPINQTILSTFMRRKKIKYDLANNGQEAVQKWRTGGFHLILMDIQMPVMDGIQATKEIRRMEKSNASAGYPPLSPTSTDGGHTPSSSSASETRFLNSPYRSSVIIVALTASSLQSDRVAALAAGCNDFLTKPVSLLWLNNKIIEWGSIKALQMWADIRPDNMRTITSGQEAQARNIAENLHVPNAKERTPQIRRSSSVFEESAAVIGLASAGSSSSVISPATPSSLSQDGISKMIEMSSPRKFHESHPSKRKRDSLDADNDADATPSHTRGLSVFDTQSRHVVSAHANLAEADLGTPQPPHSQRSLSIEPTETRNGDIQSTEQQFVQPPPSPTTSTSTSIHNSTPDNVPDNPS